MLRLMRLLHLPYSRLQEATGDYSRLHVATAGYRWLQEATGGYRWLQVTTGDYRGLQVATGGRMLHCGSARARSNYTERPQRQPQHAMALSVLH